MEYISVKTAKTELIVKKSSFIAFAYPISDGADAADKLAALRKEYYDSTHVCFAYIADESGSTVKFSDDGEPGGTAGQPILEVLRKSGLKKVLVAVVRYFGGVLLGAGGLVHAYSQAASDVLRAAEKVKYGVFDKYSLSLDFSLYRKVSTALSKSFKIGKVEYSDVVNVELLAQEGADADSVISELTLGKSSAKYLGKTVMGEKYEQTF